MNIVSIAFPMDIMCRSMDRNGVMRQHHYRLRRTIGSGGMADVFEGEDLESLAEDGRTPKRVAIKYSKAESSTNEHELSTDAQRFRREAGIAASIQHPNVIKVIDFGVDQSNNLVLVMPYIVGGRTLTDLINVQLKAVRRAAITSAEESGRSFDPDVDPFIQVSLLDFDRELVKLFSEILDGVEAMHKVGIIHRDLKAANALIRKVGQQLEAIVSDFGIARPISEDAKLLHGGTLTQEGMIVGTPDYMPPEQFMSAKGVALDQRVDVWALAIILYEMITGRRPFSDPTDPSLRVLQHRIVMGKPYPMKMFVKDPDPGIERVILKGLEKDPENRIHDIPEFRELLTQALEERRVRQQRVVSVLSTPPPSLMMYLPASPVVIRESAPPTPQLVHQVEPDPVERLSMSAGRETVPSPERSAKNGGLLMVVGAAALLLVIGGGVWFAARPSPTNASSPPHASSPVKTVAKPVVQPTATPTAEPVVSAPPPAPTVSAKPKAQPAPASGQAAADWKDAQSYFAKGNFLFAVTSASLVVGNPEYGNFAEAYRLIGDCRRKMGKTQEACKAYQTYRSFEGVTPLSTDAQVFVDASCSSANE
jgi:serine/threonine-protein kinase